MRRSSPKLCLFRTLLPAAAAALAVNSFTPAQLVAQAATALAAAPSCIDTLSLAGATPWIVYVRAITQDSSSRMVQSVADEFAQAVAQRLRVLLHARGDTLPAGEPLLGWREFPVSAVIRVTLSRLRSPELALVPAATNSPSSTLLLRAAVESQASDDAVFWTNDMAPDSAEFVLGLVLAPNGSLSPAKGVRYAFPAFSLLHPPVTPAKVLQMPDIPYPADAYRAGGIGTVMVRFQVDTTGHVVRSTMQEEWPESQPRPTGQLLSIYSDFLQSVMTTLPTATFEPARIGDCLVNQWVMQPFSFSIKPSLIVR